MIGDQELPSIIERVRETFCQAMDDDLNTPVALAGFQMLRGDVNKLVGQGLSTRARHEARAVFRELGSVLGIFQLGKWRFHHKIELAAALTMSASLHADLQVGSSLTDDEIERKVSERNEARKQKDFKKADEIRQFLKSQGIIIEDKPDGTSRWKR
jgi:cysteinyl-tRNA synthetase